MKYIILVTLLFTASFLAAQEGRDKDGHYHDPGTGEIQPDTCNNSFKNSHKCRCNRAVSCDPNAMKQHPSYGSSDPDTDEKMGAHCQTYCRTKACNCINECGS